MPTRRLTNNRLTRHRFARKVGAELRYRFARGDRPARPDAPLVISCHHKSGSTLMHTVFRKVCAEFGWRLQWNFKTTPARLPRDVDVLVLGHGQIDLGQMESPYRGAHVIRDPRDVVVSGYQYHLYTDEDWCVNEDFDETAPINAPQIPFWIEERGEAEKREFLRSLGGRSYQENLKARSEAEGILFEISGYSAWTIDQMRAWDYDDPDVVELKFEDVLGDFDAEMRRMFVGLGLTGRWLERAVEIAATEDLGRMDRERLETDPHIQSRGSSRWERFFTDEHKAAFKERFGDAVVKLGYAESNDW